jgi:Mpv17 / PMP22 family
MNQHSSSKLLLLFCLLIFNCRVRSFAPSTNTLYRIQTAPRPDLGSHTFIDQSRWHHREKVAALIPGLQMGLSEAWDAYNSALESDPLLVKSITAAVILGLGDFAGQAVEKVRSGADRDVDFARAARFAFFGLVLQAPWNHFYYLLLDGRIPPTEEPFSSTNILKVCIDQFIQAPIFTVLIFAFLGALEGKSLEDIKKQLQNDYPETIVANCKSSLVWKILMKQCP